uniref:Ig-like domain-containing protein n=1 Tax=Cyprinus carpio TaxID=7962 RepID=A0A8C1JTH9_CYPCA
MFCVIIIITVILFYFFTGNTFANTIQPLSSEKHVVRGENVILSCNYTGDVNNLQWYRQYPGSQPEHLILVTEYSEPDLSLHLEDRPPRFTAEVNQDNKQVDLNISSAVETDSAIYYCALVSFYLLLTYHNSLLEGGAIRFMSFISKLLLY